MNVNYEIAALGDGPTVIFGTSLGADRSMWQPQLDALHGTWTAVTFDLRGHGRSAVSAKTPTIDDFADDVIAIADELELDRFVYCGLSIGGAIGQSLAARHGERMEVLVLASTGMTILSPAALHDRAERVLAEGMGWIADLSVPRWFTQRFRTEHPEVVAAQMAHMRAMDPRGYADACRALAGFDGHGVVAGITAPTLVIAGEQDIATTPEGGAELASAIAGAEFRTIADAAHLCNVEAPEEFLDLLRGFVDNRS